MIDRSFGFLDQEGYSNIHGMRPHIFNCRSEPSIPPRLNMEPLSQVYSFNNIILCQGICTMWIIFLAVQFSLKALLYGFLILNYDVSVKLSI